MFKTEDLNCCENVTYTLSGPSAPWFTMDGDKLVVVQNGVHGSFSLLVTAHDSQGGSIQVSLSFAEGDFGNYLLVHFLSNHSLVDSHTTRQCRAN